MSIDWDEYKKINLKDVDREIIESLLVHNMTLKHKNRELATMLILGYPHEPKQYAKMTKVNREEWK